MKKSDRTIYINGRFLTQRITGVQRYGLKILKKLISLNNFKYEILIPKEKEITKSIKNISIRRIGLFGGHLWEQVELPLFLSNKKNFILLNLSNTSPICVKNKISTLHDLAFYHHPEWFSKIFASFYNFLIPRILRTSQKIITDSNYAKEDIQKTYNVDKDKIVVAYPSVSDKFYNLENTKKDFFLTVGSLDPRKNLNRIIKIFEELNINLKVVGGANLNFSGKVDKDKKKFIEFTGYLNDEELLKEYNSAVAFIFPSYFEGFGMPIIEAQKCGLPVISSNKTSMPEVGGSSCIYFDPHNDQEIKTKIKKIYNDKVLRTELKKKGFENVKKFSWHKSTLIIEDMLRNL